MVEKFKFIVIIFVKVIHYCTKIVHAWLSAACVTQ